MTRVGTTATAGLLALLALAAGAQAGQDRTPAPQVEDQVAPVQPVVTLKLRVTATRASTGARVTIAGTFRGRAVAGRRTYRLLPVGGMTATHRHGAAAPQRARVGQAFLDVRSDSEYVRVVGTGPLIGGPAIDGPAGTCRRISFRFTALPKAGTAGLRWACRRAGDDRSPPIHLDVLRSPRDAIVSSYTIVRRPCSPAPAPAQARELQVDECRSDAA